MTPRATIALLNWNGGEYVRPCVESILHQSEQNVEILVVDNNSGDGSANVMEALLEAASVNYEVIRLDENRGICGGLQVALDRATGEYFFPFASDDEMLSDRVARQCDQLDGAGPNTHIAGGAVALIGPDGEQLRNWWRRPLVIRPPHYEAGDPTATMSFTLDIPPAPGLAFRTAGLRSIGGYDPAAPVEDIDTFSRLVLLGGSKVVTTDEVVSRYRRHGSNASRRTDLMADGLEHTLRTLLASDVDFGAVRAGWLGYVEARSQGYTSPWGRLLRALAEDPLKPSAVRAAGLDVLRSRLSTGRRIRGAVSIVAPRVAARWVGRMNG